MVSKIGQLRVGVGEQEAVVESLGNGEPGTGNGGIRDIAWPGDELREVVRFDERGRYRPLSGSKSLRGGWRVRCAAADVDRVVEAVYPLATVHLRQWERGELRVVSLEDVLVRQTGRYAVAAKLDEDGRRVAREVLCADCVRTPIWGGEHVEEGGIPCPEPCSVFVSLCREAALWQDEAPGSAVVDETVPYAAFERAGNGIREAYLAKRKERRAESREPRAESREPRGW